MSCRFVVISKWTNEAALEQHMMTEHVKQFGKRLEGHSSLELIRRYQEIL